MSRGDVYGRSTPPLCLAEGASRVLPFPASAPTLPEPRRKPEAHTSPFSGDEGMVNQTSTSSGSSARGLGRSPAAGTGASSGTAGWGRRRGTAFGCNAASAEPILWTPTGVRRRSSIDRLGVQTARHSMLPRKNPWTNVSNNPGPSASAAPNGERPAESSIHSERRRASGKAPPVTSGRDVRARLIPSHHNIASEGPALATFASPSVRGARRLARGGVHDSTLGTVSKRNEVLAVLSRASAARCVRNAG